MTQLIPAVIIAIASGAAAAGITASYKLPIKRLPFRKTKGKAPQPKFAARYFLMASGLLMAFFALLITIVSIGTVAEKNISVTAMICTALLVHGALLVYMLENERLYITLKKIMLASVVIMLCETFVFNLKSFDSVKKSQKLSMGDAAELANEEYNGENVVLTADNTFTFADLPDYTRCIIIDSEQKKIDEGMPYEIRLSIRDDNASRSFETVQDEFTMGSGKPVYMTANVYGKLHEIKIDFASITNEVMLRSITVCSALPFEFSTLRFIILLAIASLIAFVKEYSLYRVNFDSRKSSHLLIIQTIVLVCTISAVLFINPKMEALEQKNDGTYGDTSQPYAMLFDSFQEGHTYLNLNPEPALDELENVYDTSLRNESGIFYFWDLAYYNHHYYCYFGVAPVITFYYPYYLLTNKLPTTEMAVAFFAMLAIAFFCQTLIALTRYFHKRPNFLLFAMLIPACVSCFGAYFTLNYPALYTLPVAAGLCFLFLFFWLGITACTRKKKSAKIILLIISGAALACCVASRPGMAVSSLVIAPLFIGILLDKKQKFGFRIAQAAAFLTPALIGVFGVMLYNKARFGSLFDFGAAYQLTVNDIHSNKLSLAGIFPMLYQYFLQLPRPKNVFPFFEPQFYVLRNYTKYTYVADSVGVFTYALILFGVIFLPMAIRKSSASRMEKGAKLRFRSFLILCLSLALFIAWDDYCLGGVITRYSVDFLPLLTMMSFLVMLRVNTNPKRAAFRYKMSVISVAATFCIAWLLIISTREAYIMKTAPTLYDTVHNLLIFWQ